MRLTPRLLSPLPSEHREPGRPKLFSAYLARFMQYVNTTFPNPGHVLKNHGKSGATGVEFLSCPNEFMLPEADLVIMDHAINFWEARVVESLLGYVMNTPKAPAVLLLNLHNWRGHGVPKERWPKSAEEVQTKYGVPEAHRIEDEAASLASKWGLSAVSVYNFMYPLMNGTFPLPSPFWPLPLDRLGTHCSYVRAVDMKPYSIYIGDLMIHWFRNVVSSPGRLTGITETLGLDNAPELKNVVVSCFTWGATGRRPIVVGNNNINTGAEIPERYAGRQGITNTWFRYLTPIDGPPAVRTRRKPGFYSVVPGAVADLRIGLYTSALPKVNNLKVSCPPSRHPSRSLSLSSLFSFPSLLLMLSIPSPLSPLPLQSHLARPRSPSRSRSRSRSNCTTDSLLTLLSCPGSIS